MAAPESMTVADISGTYCMNRKLSGNTDECLSMQGVGWITRKTLSVATVTVKLQHTTDADGLETIAIANTVTGGISGSSETRILDWETRSQTDHLWGTFTSRARKTNVSDITEAYLKEGWAPGTEAVIEIESESTEKGWTAHQTWGFEVDSDGVKRYSRHLVLSTKKPAKTVYCKMMYDYYP